MKQYECYFGTGLVILNHGQITTKLAPYPPNFHTTPVGVCWTLNLRFYVHQAHLSWNWDSNQEPLYLKVKTLASTHCSPYFDSESQFSFMMSCMVLHATRALGKPCEYGFGHTHP
ncbi:hypothetical protein AVEN_175125-1 [Araneus ventricosus]|uniref:Uncharacterized protein n=1 Tax=Araneus ventricosus TaxID=182803 RepID=A0A4Y2S459_ARAVE|nr:hypothetical protein AVEN_139109-1 [Araneus ventricosus]GBN82750.1 hypothetical protein AVEN_175125-1 [Araneus ventricosus]